MTDRYNAFVVVLEQDIREDDAQAIINAIKMVKGVLDVTPHTASFEDAIATTRVRQELIEKVYKTLMEGKQ
jgi:hypothetical protein